MSNKFPTKRLKHIVDLAQELLRQDGHHFSKEMISDIAKSYFKLIPLFCFKFGDVIIPHLGRFYIRIKSAWGINREVLSFKFDDATKELLILKTKDVKPTEEDA